MKYFAYLCAAMVAILIALILSRPSVNEADQDVIPPEATSTDRNTFYQGGGEHGGHGIATFHENAGTVQEVKTIDMEQAEEDELFAKEHMEQAWKLRERKIKEQTERKRWLESRKEWIENFPFTPEYHPEVVYYAGIWDPPQLESPAFEDYFMKAHNNTGTIVDLVDSVQAHSDAIQEYIKEYAEATRERDMVENHSRLVGFYNSELRFSEEFEMLYDIFNEYGFADNTCMLAYAFDNLMDYNKALLKNPDEMSPYGITWKERADKERNAVLVAINSDKMYLNGERRPSEAQAEEIRSRILNEIPKEGFEDMELGFPMRGEVEAALQEGDQLLYK